MSFFSILKSKSKKNHARKMQVCHTCIKWIAVSDLFMDRQSPSDRYLGGATCGVQSSFALGRPGYNGTWKDYELQLEPVVMGGLFGRAS